MEERGFLILDFGSQVTQLIARRLREMGYFSEIIPYYTSWDLIKKKKPYGLILSGGPNSVYDVDSPQKNIQDMMGFIPMMGICYGMQLITHQLGGEVVKAEHREYGLQNIHWNNLVGHIPQQQKVWMSHGDVIHKIPNGFVVCAQSENHPAAIYNKEQKIFAVQFHPEVAHTELGNEVFSFFAEICEAKPEWTGPHILKHIMEQVQNKAGADHVLMGLSGGVDSTVVATLLSKTLGSDKVHCIFVNNGLLRKNEYEEVLSNYKSIGLNVTGVDASNVFLNALKGIKDPEQKRKTIGNKFIEVFESSLENHPDKNKIKWLAQGTLYPDVIESVTTNGVHQTIKSHHNVGGLPEKMKLKLLEPVRDLFKDEVRWLGKELGLPQNLLWRHPFPGPGLGIRIMGEVTEQQLYVLKEADAVYLKALKDLNLYDKIWQAFCVILPIHTVGVQGDARTYDQVLALRAVTSKDGMTADWYPFTFEELREISNRITNQVRGISRVVYDVTSKPPSTIEWE